MGLLGWINKRSNERSSAREGELKEKRRRKVNEGELITHRITFIRWTGRSLIFITSLEPKKITKTASSCKNLSQCSCACVFHE